MNDKISLFFKKLGKIFNDYTSNRLYFTIFLFFIPLVIAIFIFIYIEQKPNFSDIGINLIAEMIGASVTVLIFTIIIEANEKRKLKHHENRVHDRLSSSLYSLYSDLSTLCESVYDYQNRILSDENISFNQYSKLNSKLDLNKKLNEGNNLKFLAKKENICITEYGKKRLLSIDEIFRINPTIWYRFDYILDKDYSFLELSVQKSISKIDYNIENLFRRLWVIETSGVPDDKDCEVYFNMVKEILANIFTEIEYLQNYSGLRIVPY